MDEKGILPQVHAEHANDKPDSDLSGRIIDCASRVLNTFGANFLEKVYENALAHELCAAGLAVAQQKGIAFTTTAS